jgi:hypothetical protein
MPGCEQTCRSQKLFPLCRAVDDTVLPTSGRAPQVSRVHAELTLIRSSIWRHFAVSLTFHRQWAADSDLGRTVAMLSECTCVSQRCCAHSRIRTQSNTKQHLASFRSEPHVSSTSAADSDLGRTVAMLSECTCVSQRFSAHSRIRTHSNTKQHLASFRSEPHVSSTSAADSDLGQTVALLSECTCVSQRCCAHSRIRTQSGTQG